MDEEKRTTEDNKSQKFLDSVEKQENQEKEEKDSDCTKDAKTSVKPEDQKVAAKQHVKDEATPFEDPDVFNDRLNAYKKVFDELSRSECQAVIATTKQWKAICDGWNALGLVCSDVKPYVGISSFLWQTSVNEKKFLPTLAKFFLLYKVGFVPVNCIVFINYGLLLQASKRIAVVKETAEDELFREHLLQTDAYKEIAEKCRLEMDKILAPEVSNSHSDHNLRKKISNSSVYTSVISKLENKVLGKELIGYLKYELPESDVVCVSSSCIFGTGERNINDTLPASVSANHHNPAMSMLIGGFPPQIECIIFRLGPMMNFTDGSSDFHQHLRYRMHKKNAKAMVAIFKEVLQIDLTKERINVIDSWIRKDGELDIAMGGVVAHSAYIMKKNVFVESAVTGVGIIFCGKNVSAASVVLPKKQSRSKIKKALKKVSDEGIVKPGDSSFAFIFTSTRLSNQCFEQVFRECFPNTPLVGCVGSSQLGVDYYPGCASKPERKDKVEKMIDTTVVVVCSAPE